MQRDRSKSSPGVFTNPVVFLATLALLGPWQGWSFSKQGASTESKPATAPTSQDQSATPQDQSSTEPKTAAESKSSGGEHLSKKEVSTLPLNKRDFSQLLLLAAGTMTDTNGAANFTQQFAVNGQRGVTTVFAMDGIDTTDPEMGGSTFSNFNVDAIQEVRSSSGVMLAEIGHGAAGFTDIITRSGTDDLHGSMFEFLRNSALDARNFFDERSPVSPGRIPHFVRNEFGFTLGGLFVVPGLYNGRKRTYFFGQYQGFRQLLGTTQILSVPSMQERQGVDTTAFPGDTLLVPLNPQISTVLAHYPVPDDPQGPFGDRTYATSAPVSTGTDQFSFRIDHRISEQSQFYARFSLNQVSGPLTNPDQTAIDPTFATRFFDHQRNGGFRYTRTVSPHFTSETTVGVERSTPFFPTINTTQPGLAFGDGLFEPFNNAAGTNIGAFTSLMQARQSFSFVHGSHSMKWGFETRFNRDTTVFDLNPNGIYTFGGGTAYAQAPIPSLSGQHNIQAGDPLPDTLSAILTGTPFSYSISVAPTYFPQGNRVGEAAARRAAYNIYFQDAWKITPRLSINYGLRYEVNSRIAEAHHLTADARIVNPEGTPTVPWERGASIKYLVNPQPPYGMDWRGWGPRLGIDWQVTDHTVWHAGGAISTILTNIWQDNFLTGGLPYTVGPLVTAQPNVTVPFAYSVTGVALPPIYTVAGQQIYAQGPSTAVPPNTELDLLRFQNDLTAHTPGHELQFLGAGGISPDFRNGYIGTYTAGFEHSLGDVKLSVSYVATAGIHLSAMQAINGYAGASPEFAPFLHTDSSGNAISGYGPSYLISTRSHSTYQALQTGVEKTSPRAGLGFQASYTYSKSLDDTSAVLGGFFGSTGPVLQTLPQDPRNPGLEKAPSTFDTTQVFALSLIQALPFGRASFLRPVSKKVTSGWQILNIITLTTGSPFGVYTGIQQTGMGSGGADRPDRIGRPIFSTSRTVREDYFGEGSNNADYFHIPIEVPGGTGPNQGVFGTLGRNTFRGPGFHDLDFSLTKDTSFGRRGNTEAAILQFRAEFFNVFNLVDFGLPLNVIRGTGFGIINKTAGTSRQIQFALRLIF
jgi:hypothetical protein